MLHKFQLHDANISDEIWSQFVNKTLNYYFSETVTILSPEKYSLHIDTEESYENLCLDIGILLENVKAYLESEKNSIITDKLPDSKVLNIIIQNHITLYSDYVVPLSIIFAKDMYKEWFYNHFIQVYAAMEIEKQLYCISYCDNNSIFDEILDLDYLYTNDIYKIDNIIDFIKYNIAKDSYFFMTFDEFYLNDKDAYKKYHFPHRSLIYGYDDLKKEVYAIGFGENSILKKSIYTYHEIKDGFLGRIVNHRRNSFAGDHVLKGDLISFKKHPKDTSFDSKLFLQQLNDYLYSVSDRYIQTPKMSWLPEAEIYGKSVYYELVNVLEKAYKGECECKFQNFHIFWEQRRLIYDRLAFYYDNYISTKDTDFRIINLLNKYQEIVARCNSLRMLFLKERMMNRLIENYKKFSILLSKILEDEQMVLESMLSLLTA